MGLCKIILLTMVFFNVGVKSVPMFDPTIKWCISVKT